MSTTSQILAGLPDLADATEPDPLMGRLEGATYDLDGIGNIPPPEPLIVDVLPLDSLAAIIGPSGIGKSFVALDMALCVAHGIDWHDHTVTAGPVVYVAAEGARGVGQRVAAWLEHHQHPRRRYPVHFLALPVNVFQAEWAATLADYCETRTPNLVVLDTLARCTVGAEENAAKDMGRVVEHLDTIRRRTGACVAPVHHTGKDTGRGGRGSSALLGATDTELTITGGGNTVQIRWTKTKDSAEPRPLTLERQVVGASCVLVAGTESLLTSGALESLSALRSIEVPGGIAAGAWLDSCEASKTTFYRHRQQLLDAGQVVNVGSVKQPRYLTASRHEEDSCG